MIGYQVFPSLCGCWELFSARLPGSHSAHRAEHSQGRPTIWHCGVQGRVYSHYCQPCYYRSWLSSQYYQALPFLRVARFQLTGFEHLLCPRCRARPRETSVFILNSKSVLVFPGWYHSTEMKQNAPTGKEKNTKNPLLQEPTLN